VSLICDYRRSFYSTETNYNCWEKNPASKEPALRRLFSKNANLRRCYQLELVRKADASFSVLYPVLVLFTNIVLPYQQSHLQITQAVTLAELFVSFIFLSNLLFKLLIRRLNQQKSRRPKSYDGFARVRKLISAIPALVSIIPIYLVVSITGETNIFRASILSL